MSETMTSDILKQVYSACDPAETWYAVHPIVRQLEKFKTARQKLPDAIMP